MKQTKEYNILSPDGFPIFRELTYKSVTSAKKAFKEWKKRFEAQGYYSSNEGRIDLRDLEESCTLTETDLKPLFKVVKVFRKSQRRQIIRRNLSEGDAQILVKSFPHRNTSMVIYTKQN